MRCSAPARTLYFPPGHFRSLPYRLLPLPHRYPPLRPPSCSLLPPRPSARVPTPRVASRARLSRQLSPPRSWPCTGCCPRATGSPSSSVCLRTAQRSTRRAQLTRRQLRKVSPHASPSRQQNELRTRGTRNSPSPKAKRTSFPLLDAADRGEEIGLTRARAVRRPTPRPRSRNRALALQTPQVFSAALQEQQREATTSAPRRPRRALGPVRARPREGVQ